MTRRDHHYKLSVCTFAFFLQVSLSMKYAHLCVSIDGRSDQTYLAHLVHNVHRRWVSPVAVMDGYKGDACPLAVERCEHHVTRV